MLNSDIVFDKEMGVFYIVIFCISDEDLLDAILIGLCFSQLFFTAMEVLIKGKSSLLNGGKA